MEKPLSKRAAARERLDKDIRRRWRAALKVAVADYGDDDACRRADVDPKTFHDWQTGKRFPPAPAFARACEGLDIAPGAILLDNKPMRLSHRRLGSLAEDVAQYLATAIEKSLHLPEIGYGIDGDAALRAAIAIARQQLERARAFHSDMGTYLLHESALQNEPDAQKRKSRLDLIQFERTRKIESHQREAAAHAGDGIVVYDREGVRVMWVADTPSVVRMKPPQPERSPAPPIGTKFQIGGTTFTFRKADPSTRKR